MTESNYGSTSYRSTNPTVRQESEDPNELPIPGQLTLLDYRGGNVYAGRAIKIIPGDTPVPQAGTIEYSQDAHSITVENDEQPFVITFTPYGPMITMRNTWTAGNNEPQDINNFGEIVTFPLAIIHPVVFERKEVELPDDSTIPFVGIPQHWFNPGNKAYYDMAKLDASTALATSWSRTILDNLTLIKAPNTSVTLQGLQGTNFNGGMTLNGSDSNGGEGNWQKMTYVATGETDVETNYLRFFTRVKAAQIFMQVFIDDSAVDVFKNNDDYYSPELGTLVGSVAEGVQSKTSRGFNINSGEQANILINVTCQYSPTTTYLVTIKRP